MLAIFSKIKNIGKVRGVTLVEAVLYLTLLIFVLGVVINMLMTINGSYREIRLNREIEISGTITMESLLREIRNASSIDTGNSQFDINPSKITLVGIDEYSNSYTKTYDVLDGVFRVSKNGGAPETLTSSLGSINSFVLKRLATSTSEAVRIELEIIGTLGSLSKTEKFYGFAVLRGSY